MRSRHVVFPARMCFGLTGFIVSKVWPTFITQLCASALSVTSCQGEFAKILAGLYQAGQVSSSRRSQQGHSPYLMSERASRRPPKEEWHAGISGHLVKFHVRPTDEIPWDHRTAISTTVQASKSIKHPFSKHVARVGIVLRII